MTDPDAYEYVRAVDLRPGDTIRPSHDDSPVVLTAVRTHYNGTGISPGVSLYREPTDKEYERHLEEHGTDLRATWISSCVGDYHFLRFVPYQPGDLAH